MRHRSVRYFGFRALLAVAAADLQPAFSTDLHAVDDDGQEALLDRLDFAPGERNGVRTVVDDEPAVEHNRSPGTLPE